MRSIVSRSGLPTLLAVLTMLGLAAATAPHDSAAANRAQASAITVKTAQWTRGSVVLHVKARRDLGSAVVRLDGRRVESDLPRHRGQRRAIVLDRADGVRFGRNAIAVKVRTRGGARALVRRVVMVRRDAPLPAIQQPRRIVASHAARLDGRKTRSARRGKLNFRWQVVRAPAGAWVSLRGAGGRRPQLLASVPGHYRIALTVTERQAPARGATASAAPCAVSGSKSSAQGGGLRRGPVASMPLERLPKGALTVVDSRSGATPKSGPQPRAVPGCATTVTDVEVEPNLEPIGAVIDTRAEHEETAGIRLGDSFYPFPTNGETGARFILLDAQTLELIRTENVNLTTSHQTVAQLMVTESAPGRDVLVVSSGRYACCTQDSSDAYAGFSAIESYDGGRRVSATENQGLDLGAVNESENQFHGELAGWLRPGVSLDGAQELFAFVNPERFAFDTQASSSAFSNTIRVGSSEYPTRLSGAVGGFEVLVLGPGLEPELGTPAGFGTISSTGEGQAQEEAMTALLNQAGPLQTVIVQSIGTAQPYSGAATALGQALARMGASPWTFFSLNGAGGYAFVGNGFSQQVAPGVAEPRVAETSEQWVRSVGGAVNGGGSLHGLLTRNSESALFPGISDPIGTPNYELEQVTYQPGVQWPQTETVGKVAATQYLAEALGLEAGPGSCYRPAQPDFRSSYCDRSLNLDATENKLERQKYPVNENVSFTQAEFEAVQNQLGTELDDVADVREMVSALQVPLGGQSPAVDSQAIAGEVLAALPQGSGNGNATAANLSLAAAVLYAGEYIPEVGEVLGPIAAVLGLAGELAQENGEYSPDWRIQASADEIGGKVKNRLAAMSAGLGTIEEILVTDWGKLSTTAAAAAGAWGITARGIQRQTSTIELGINQWMWRAILPAAFDLVSFPGAPEGSQSQLHCVTSIAPTEWSPWRSAPSESVFFPLVGFEGGRRVTSGAFGMLDGSYSKSSATRVSSALAGKIFGSPEQGGAALTAPRLFEDSDWTVDHPHMIEEESPLKPGYCGF
jgi:hypothetical protein